MGIKSNYVLCAFMLCGMLPARAMHGGSHNLHDIISMIDNVAELVRRVYQAQQSRERRCREQTCEMALAAALRQNEERRQAHDAEQERKRLLFKAQLDAELRELKLDAPGVTLEYLGQKRDEMQKKWNQDVDLDDNCPGFSGVACDDPALCSCRLIRAEVWREPIQKLSDCYLESRHLLAICHASSKYAPDSKEGRELLDEIRKCFSYGHARFDLVSDQECYHDGKTAAAIIEESDNQELKQLLAAYRQRKAVGMYGYMCDREKTDTSFEQENKHGEPNDQNGEEEKS